MKSDWTQLKASHSGKTYILGNGPSLTDHNLSKMPEPTFGINRSYKVRKSTYHVAIDLSTFEGVAENALKELPLVFSVEGRSGDKTYSVQLKSLGNQIAWSFDPEVGVFPRFSTYVALQLAAWMGFDEIVLLGTDLCERSSKGHFYDKPDTKVKLARIYKHQTTCFREVERISKEFPLPKIYNCSSISKLKVFPMVEFNDVV